MKRYLALSGAAHAILLGVLVLWGGSRLDREMVAPIEVRLVQGLGVAGGPGNTLAAPVRGEPPKPAAITSPPRNSPPSRAQTTRAGTPRGRIAQTGHGSRKKPAPILTASLQPWPAPGRRPGPDDAADLKRPAGAEPSAVIRDGLQIARGGIAGGGTASGMEGSAPAELEGGVGGPGDEGERDRRIAIIRQRIQRALIYPAEARRRGVEGVAQVQFDVKVDGRVRGLGLARTSGKKLLDRASLETIERAQPFPYVDGTLLVPVVFRLSR